MFRLLAALLLTAAPLSAETLTIASYNIKHGQGTDSAVDLARPAKVLAALNADIIALQEVDMQTRRTGFVDQSASLAAALNRNGGDWRHLDAPAIPFEGGHYGNAMLFNAARLELVDYQTLPLPDSPEGDGARSAALARFKAANGTVFAVAGTHLTHKNQPTDGNSSIQLDSVRALNAAFPADLPGFIAGDLNASADSADNHNQATLSLLADLGWRIDSPTDGRTVPDEGQEFVIDYILSKANTRPVEAAKIIDDETTAVASDHFPVVVTYRLAD